jgi:hypothetical protein
MIPIIETLQFKIISMIVAQIKLLTGCLCSAGHAMLHVWPFFRTKSFG